MRSDAHLSASPSDFRRDSAAWISSPSTASIAVYWGIAGRCQVCRRLRCANFSTTRTSGDATTDSGSALTENLGAIGNPLVTCAFIASCEVIHEIASAASLNRSSGRFAGMIRR